MPVTGGGAGSGENGRALESSPTSEFWRPPMHHEQDEGRSKVFACVFGLPQTRKISSLFSVKEIPAAGDCSNDHPAGDQQSSDPPGPGWPNSVRHDSIQHQRPVGSRFQSSVHQSRPPQHPATSSTYPAHHAVRCFPHSINRGNPVR